MTTETFNENGHLQSCLTRITQQNAVYEAYAKKWPKFCRACHATSVIGDTPCSLCADTFHCARCGKKTLNGDGTLCRVCHWGYYLPTTHAPSQEQECDCADFEEEIAEAPYDH